MTPSPELLPLCRTSGTRSGSPQIHSSTYIPTSSRLQKEAFKAQKQGFKFKALLSFLVSNFETGFSLHRDQSRRVDEHRLEKTPSTQTRAAPSTHEETETRWHKGSPLHPRCARACVHPGCTRRNGQFAHSRERPRREQAGQREAAESPHAAGRCKPDLGLKAPLVSKFGCEKDSLIPVLSI